MAAVGIASKQMVPVVISGNLGEKVDEVRGVGQIRQHGSPLSRVRNGQRPSSNAPLALPTVCHSYSSDRH